MYGESTNCLMGLVLQVLNVVIIIPGREGLTQRGSVSVISGGNRIYGLLWDGRYYRGKQTTRHTHCVMVLCNNHLHKSF